MIMKTIDTKICRFTVEDLCAKNVKKNAKTDAGASWTSSNLLVFFGVQDVVYWGMDWLIAGYSKSLSSKISFYYGNLTAEIAIKEIIAKTQTGNLHIALYDYSNNRVLVSFAEGKSSSKIITKKWEILFFCSFFSMHQTIHDTKIR